MKFSAKFRTSDFQKQDVHFNIDKLKNAYIEILKIKGFDTSLGIPHFERKKR